MVGTQDNVVDPNALASIHGKNGSQVINYPGNHDLVVINNGSKNETNADDATQKTIQMINNYR
jgi:3',5'-cyclic AMP phosphodiesterase CpdA